MQTRREAPAKRADTIGAATTSLRSIVLVRTIRGNSVPRQSQPARPDDDQTAEHRLPPLLRRAWYGLNQAFRRRIAPLGITPDQFTVLRWLGESPRAGLTQRELADRMASDPNTVTGLLKRMTAAGWVERVDDPADKRVKRCRLAPAGRRIYRAAAPIAARLQDDVLGRLTAAQREHFLNTLRTVADACQDELERSGRAVRAAGRARRGTGGKPER